MYFGCSDMYFACLNLYFECLDIYLGCLNLYFECLDFIENWISDTVNAKFIVMKIHLMHSGYVYVSITQINHIAPSM